MDILDTIDELETETVEDDDLEIIEAGSELEEYSELSEEQAQDLTDAIRATATATYILLNEAHAKKAYKALGYDTWADYVKTEFDMSASRSYQLMDLGKVIEQLEAVTPEGTKVKLTEAQARDIKRELPKITEQVQEATKDEEDPEKAAELVNDIVEEIREQKKADEEEVNRRQQALEEAELEGYQKGIEAASDALLEADMNNNMSEEADDGLYTDVVASSGSSPEDAMNLYNLQNALSSITSLPEPDDFIESIPDAMAQEIDNQLMEAVSWMNRFQTLWELKDE